MNFSNIKTFKTNKNQLETIKISIISKGIKL